MVVRGAETDDLGVTVEVLLTVTEDVSAVVVDTVIEVADEEVEIGEAIDVELEVAIEVVVDVDVSVLRSVLSRYVLSTHHSFSKFSPRINRIAIGRVSCSLKFALGPS